MSRYRIRFSDVGRCKARCTAHAYYDLQVRRWWGWSTIGYGFLHEVEALRAELVAFEKKEAQP